MKAGRELCEKGIKSSREEDMIIPKGYVFRSTDEELLIHNLERKRKHLSLPSNIIFEQEIYGFGDKAPWTKSTIYVFTRLRKFSKNSVKAARLAGCGSWHAETSLEDVRDNKGTGVIGSKRMLCFRIDEKLGAIDEEGARKYHWIMHEYSLGGSKSLTRNEEYVLCRIKRKDSKDAKKSVRKVNNVEAGRIEFVSEQKMDCDIAAELETEVVPLSEDLFEQKLGFMTIVVPTGLAPVLEVAQPPKSSVEDLMQYLSLELIECLAENLSNTEILLSAELLPRYEESNRFLPPNSGFDATTEPLPIYLVSNNMEVQLEPASLTMGMGAR